MTDVKLGDNIYEGVQAVMMDTTDGGTATFVEWPSDIPAEEAEIALTWWEAKKGARSWTVCSITALI